MWVLNFVPDWIFHAVLLIGIMALVASQVLKFLPFVTVYRLPIQAAGLVLVVVGVWFQGAISNQAAWQARVHEMQQQVAAAEVKSAQENVRIVTQVITKIQTVKETTNANQQFLASAVAQDLDRECTLTDASVLLHNRSSQNQVASSAASVDGGPSAVKASQLISTVVENYGTYYQVVERLRGWQDWYRTQQAIFEQID